MPPRRILPSAIALCALVSLSVASQAPAQTPPDSSHTPSEADIRKASELYGKGKNLLEAGQLTEALSALEESYATVPSPNSALLIARCLRDMRRTDEAIRRYEQVEAEASAKAAAGEAKYKPTAEAAAAERKELLAQVGTIRVRVKNAPPGTDISVNGEAKALTADGSAEVRVMPGETRVLVRRFGQEPVTRTVTATKGETAELEVDISSPPESSGSFFGNRKWMLPAAIAAGGVGVVGMGLFTGFGLSSQATYEDLKRKCGFSCQGRRAEVKSGETQQTVANVSLVIGLVGLAAGGTLFTLWYTGKKHNDSSASQEAGSIGLSLGPEQAVLQGTF